MIEKGIEAGDRKGAASFNFRNHYREIENWTALASSEEGMKGIDELRFICDNVTKLGLSSAILDLDVTLARD
jgi:histidyl-tRNA synthetase